MAKFFAILNVIAWGGFWAFGFLALSTHPDDVSQMIIASVLAVLGAGAGLFSYLYLVRHSERTGYSKPANRAV